MTAKSLGNIARPMAALIAIAVVITVGLDRGARFLSQPPVLAANAAPKGAETATTRVDVMKPHQGGLPRISVQPGSIHAFEAAEIYAKVSGRLHILNVDIGDWVKEGQILAEVEVPELHRDVDRSRAAVEKANAQVGQMKARIKSAEAAHHAAETGIDRA